MSMQRLQLIMAGKDVVLALYECWNRYINSIDIAQTTLQAGNN